MKALADNVQNTIGVAHEIIYIDNTNNAYGICQAYNNAARQAKYQLLCFVHEDVVFCSQKWGEILTKLLDDQSLGVVGVAGSTYKASTISGWWDVPTSFLRKHLIQHTREGIIKEDTITLTQGQAEVTTLDGVFLATRREVWQQYPFDEVSFSGFHFYDTDFCTQVGQTYQIMVTSEIKLEHLSPGNPVSKSWIENAIKYHQKWKNYLPLGKTSDSYVARFSAEKLANLKLIQRARQTGFPLLQLLKATLRHVRFPYWLLLVVLLPLKVIQDTLKAKQ